MENKNITPFNRILYIMFVIFAAYQFFGQHAYVEAASSLGIGLAFDPFNTEQPWNERPLWQKIWLFAHLAIVALLFGYGVGIADK
jgi:hypothetical protein